MSEADKSCSSIDETMDESDLELDVVDLDQMYTEPSQSDESVPYGEEHDFILLRIREAVIHMVEQTNSGNYSGLHYRFSLGGSAEESIRGLILLGTLQKAWTLFKDGKLMTYRALLYHLHAKYTFVEKKLIPMEQMRPNCRLLEKIINIPPHTLPFYGRPNGYMALGKEVTIFEDDAILIQPRMALLPSKNIKRWGKISTTATKLLVVEHHAEMQNLVEDGILDQIPDLIIITGCGSFDIGTRLFISKFNRDTRITTFGYFDCDPGGAISASTLVFGTYGHGRCDPSELTIPTLIPIGPQPSEIVDAADVESLTITDKRRLKILKRKWWSHGLQLSPESLIWRKIHHDFHTYGKKMSLAKFRLARESNDPINFLKDEMTRILWEKEQFTLYECKLLSIQLEQLPDTDAACLHENQAA